MENASSQRLEELRLEGRRFRGELPWPQLPSSAEFQRMKIAPRHELMVRSILHQHAPQVAVAAYGSRARGPGYIRPGSDLDLAIFPSGAWMPSQTTILRASFRESDLPFYVDVIEWNTAEPVFQQCILPDLLWIVGRASAKLSATQLAGTSSRNQSV